MNTLQSQSSLISTKIITIPAMKLAGIKWTCSNEKLIETKFASLQENIGKLTSLQLKAKSPKLYNMAINMTESYKKYLYNHYKT